MASSVTRVAAAASNEALSYFSSLLKYETDCWDVHHAITNNRVDFILLDVRAESCFDNGHIEQAINIPHQKLTKERLEVFAQDTLFVVYCAGPHCNATEKAAIRLAKLTRPVKKMIGGVTGWQDEGFSLVKGN